MKNNKIGEKVFIILASLGAISGIFLIFSMGMAMLRLGQ